MRRSRGNLTLWILGIVFFGIGALEFLGLLVACVTSLLERGVLPPWPAFLFVIFHGGTFGGIGLVILLIPLRTAQRKTDLLANGTPVLARIVAVEKDYSLRVNRQCAWRVICELDEDGSVYRFRSDRLWEYPALDNEYVAVYRDPLHPRRYYVDVESSCRPTVEL